MPTLLQTLGDVFVSEADKAAASVFLAAVNDERQRRGFKRIKARSVKRALRKYFAHGLPLTDALWAFEESKRSGDPNALSPTKVAKSACLTALPPVDESMELVP